jgi:DNA repair protein RecN (Recombination protein N)
MLSHLTVKNLALIDHVELSFAPGLTVLTGETGAGKSILVEALLLLLGQRASADVVRQGASEGVVEAVWHLPEGSVATDVQRALDDAGLPPLEDGQLVLRRVVSREGRHKQQVNGALCTVTQLKTVAENLVDFTGQHAHQQLVRHDAALPLVDGFAGHTADVTAMAEAWRRARAVTAELAELRTKEAEKERRLDVIRFYLDEIETLNPQPGEDVSLESDRRRLLNAGKLRDAVAEASALITDGDNDALTKVQQAQQALRRAARDDDSLQGLVESLEGAIAVLDDVARDLARRADVESDPARLEHVEDRLDALKKVMKKHGGDLEAVLHAQAELQAERTLLQDATERIAALEGEVASAVTAAAAIAARLSLARTAAAAELGRAIEAELPALGMRNARIQVVVEPLANSEGSLRASDGRALSQTGADQVEIRFSANAGEAPTTLSKVASGGELSRILLAVKRVLLDRDPVPVSVFDEVDAGVGGAIGEAIGEKLEAIAGRNRQVLCITHLPQIACRGEHHLVVSKEVREGRTVSQVRLIDDEAREGELARMLGGREITATTLSHAREMLLHAREGRARRAAAAPASLPPPALGTADKAGVKVAEKGAEKPAKARKATAPRPAEA